MKKASLIALLAAVVILLSLVGGGWRWGSVGHSHRIAGWTWDDAALSDVWVDDAPVDSGGPVDPGIQGDQAATEVSAV